MKRIILPLVLFLSSLSLLLAQGVPMGMQYQAVARDLTAQVLPDTRVELRVNLLAEGNSDLIVYSERHLVTTNMLGLFSLTIGQGEALAGTFANVPWASEEIWMEVQIQEANGDFATVSNSKMLSVPYAFYAATAGEIMADKKGPQKAATPGVPAQVWSLFGNEKTNPAKDKLGTTDCADLVIVTNNVERMRILCSGKILIDSDLDVGNDLTVQNNVEVNISGGSTIVHGDLSVVDGSTTNLTGPLNVDGPTDLNNTLNVDGVTDLNNTLNVTGGNTTNLTGILNVTNISNLGSTLNVNNNSTTNLSGALNVFGPTILNNSFTVNNASPSLLTGTLTVTGTTTLQSDLSVADCIRAGGQTNEAKFLFCPEIVNGASAAASNYPLQLSGAQQGLAITTKDNTPANKFLAFFSGSEMRGRIEGNNGFIVDNFNGVTRDLLEYDPDDAKNSITIDKDGGTTSVDASSEANDAASTPIPSDARPVDSRINTEETVELVLLALDFIAAIVEVATSFTSVFDPVDIFEAALGGVVCAANLGVFIGFSIANVGVAYESGSGDYAEWLEKYDVEEQLYYGEVVGVIGGKVSKSFVEADKFMVVSAAPAVLGAMPAGDEQEEAFEKIAFVGQVPVKVRGLVEIGDYILPSGEGDGLAIAVHKENMLALDYARIIGVAWQASDATKRGEVYQMINTAVGINQNDMAGMIDQMQTVMNSMQEAIAQLNPDYEVYAFATNGTTPMPGTAAPSYSAAPTNRTAMQGYFQGQSYESREELGQLIVSALETQAEVDMSQYPVIERMLLDPEYAAQAEAHYTELLGTYTDWLKELQGN